VQVTTAGENYISCFSVYVRTTEMRIQKWAGHRFPAFGIYCLLRYNRQSNGRSRCGIECAKADSFFFSFFIHAVGPTPGVVAEEITIISNTRGAAQSRVLTRYLPGWYTYSQRDFHPTFFIYCTMRPFTAVSTARVNGLQRAHWAPFHQRPCPKPPTNPSVERG